ncbi:MAG: hypothetical protein ACK4N6_01560 [Rhodocyclaceae bacterium]
MAGLLISRSLAGDAFFAAFCAGAGVAAMALFAAFSAGFGATAADFFTTGFAVAAGLAAVFFAAGCGVALATVLLAGFAVVLRGDVVLCFAADLDMIRLLSRINDELYPL